MSTAFTDQLLCNLSLIRLYLACVEQNTAIKTVIDACSLLAKLDILWSSWRTFEFIHH